MSTELTINHHINFKYMMQSLKLVPDLGNSGLRDVVQAADRLGPYPKIEANAQGVLDEAAVFMNVAYGAVLSLVYFRALSDHARYAWDRQIRKWSEEALRTANKSAAQRRKSSIIMATGRVTPETLSAYRSEQQSEILGYRKMDFFRNLQNKKLSVFSSNVNKDVNDPDRLIV